MELKAGKNYLTRNGTRASVWEWDEKRQYWKGTVENGGISAWHKDGRDFYGTIEWDIVEEKQTAQSGQDRS